MRKDADWRALYPYASHYAMIDGHRMHYLDEGTGPLKNGTGSEQNALEREENCGVSLPVPIFQHTGPLLLVHGNPTWSFHWRNLIVALRDRHRLVAPDHIGCGLSDKPQHYEYRLARHINNLVELVETLDLRDVTLLAQDWGGPIGLGAALRMPERFSRFVLFNTGAFLPSRQFKVPWRIRICRTPLLGTLAIRGLNAFVRTAFRMAVEKSERLTPEVRAGIAAPYDSWVNRIAIDRFVRDIPTSPSHPSYATLADIEHNLPRLADKPFQFIWGMCDWCFTPAFLDRFLAIFPLAEVHPLPEAGHWVVEDAHELIVPLLKAFQKQQQTP